MHFHRSFPVVFLLSACPQTDTAQLYDAQPDFSARTLSSCAHTDHMRRLCTNKVAPAEQRGIWRKYLEVKNADKTTFKTPIEANSMPAPASKSPEELEFVVDSGASMHMMSKKRLKLR